MGFKFEGYLFKFSGTMENVMTFFPFTFIANLIN